MIIVRYGPLTLSRAFVFDMGLFDLFFGGKEEKKRKAFESAGALISFIYTYGSMSEGMTAFIVEQEGEQVSLSYRKVSMKDGREVGSNMFIPVERLQGLRDIIEKEEIFLWDGFHKTNSVISTGRSFAMNAHFENMDIRAEGIVMLPKDFDEKHSALTRYLTGLVKRYYTEITEV